MMKFTKSLLGERGGEQGLGEDGSYLKDVDREESGGDRLVLIGSIGIMWRTCAYIDQSDSYRN